MVTPSAWPYTAAGYVRNNERLSTMQMWTLKTSGVYHMKSCTWPSTCSLVAVSCSKSTEDRHGRVGLF